MQGRGHTEAASFGDEIVPDCPALPTSPAESGAHHVHTNAAARRRDVTLLNGGLYSTVLSAWAPSASGCDQPYGPDR